MLMVWHKLKKALSFKPKVNNSQNETYHSNSTASPLPSSSLSHYPSPTTRSSKETCVICLESMEAGNGKAIFTAECGHSFHFSCIGKNFKHGNHLCPICRCKWKEISFQFATEVIVRRRRIQMVPPVNFSRPQHVQFSDGGSSNNTGVIGYETPSMVSNSQSLTFHTPR